jgi:hypothetical protein
MRHSVLRHALKPLTLVRPAFMDQDKISSPFLKIDVYLDGQSI